MAKKDDKKWFLVDIDCHKHIKVAIKTYDREMAEQDAEKLVSCEMIDLTDVIRHGGTDEMEIKATEMHKTRVPSKGMLRFREVEWGRLERMT